MECRKYNFRKIKNGSFKAAIDLEANTSHALKYLIDDTYVEKMKLMDMLRILLPLEKIG